MSEFVRHRHSRETRADDFEYFFGPVTQISLAKRLTLHADANSVSDRILPPIRFRLWGIESSSDDVFVIGVHFGRCHPDGTMMCVIERMQLVAENVQAASHIRMSEIAKHFRL